MRFVLAMALFGGCSSGYAAPKPEGLPPTAAATATPGPTAEPAPPTGPKESLGGAEHGKALNAEGFSCDGPRCEREAEIAGVGGTLIVRLCAGVVHQVAFRKDFYTPDLVAARIGQQNRADGMLWLGVLTRALMETGWTERKPSPEELAAIQEALAPMQSSSGHQMQKPEFSFIVHKDGRHRVISLVELPPTDPAAAAIDPHASMLRFTLSTQEPAPCTAGI